MSDDIPTEKAGFKVLLYGLFHIRDITKHPAIDSKSFELLEKKYGDEKIRIICNGLKWAVDNPQLDYKSIFPGMKYTNEEIIWYFKKTLKEMIDVGAFKENGLD